MLNRIVVWCGGIMIGIGLGMIITTAHWKKESVKAGKAEWYFDDEYNKHWRWKP